MAMRIKVDVVLAGADPVIEYGSPRMDGEKIEIQNV